jgi:hypothetical protein
LILDIIVETYKDGIPGHPFLTGDGNISVGVQFVKK